jgi:hypothetical protein
MKYIFSILFFSTLSSILQAHTKDDNDSLKDDQNWLSQTSEYKKEVQKIKENSLEILKLLELYDLNIVKKVFENLDYSLGETEKILNELDDSENTEMKNKFYGLYESTLDSYDRLLILYDFYTQLQDKKEEWSNEYFSLWEKTYTLKTRIDRMYVKEEKMNVHYGGMSDYKYQSVRKRNLYEACTNIYNASLLDLKSTGDCEHYERIQILIRLLPVMSKCEKLSFEENTRDLERDLRKEDDIQKKAQYILDFVTVQE